MKTSAKTSLGLSICSKTHKEVTQSNISSLKGKEVTSPITTSSRQQFPSVEEIFASIPVFLKNKESNSSITKFPLPHQRSNNTPFFPLNLVTKSRKRIIESSQEGTNSLNFLLYLSCLSSLCSKSEYSCIYFIRILSDKKI